MMLHADFPTSPYAILEPGIRWYPGDDLLDEMGYEKLLPPLVYKIRKGVKKWRDSGYEGASETTKALLQYWFGEEHKVQGSDGINSEFRYYFSQREAVESVIWLYEIEKARDPYALMKYDASGSVSHGLFNEDWTRYVMKMATGSGKTKVMTLLIAWSYFHRKYENGSDLSTNFLVIAPNIIVLERLKTDFMGLAIFFNDPVIPYNGYEGQNWLDDFQVTLHLQDEIGIISQTGNIFLTNIHRVYQRSDEPSINDDDVSDYFLGPKPVGATTDSGVELDSIIREIPDLVILNDEAHHIHDPDMAWFKNIEDIVNQLRLRDGSLSAQFDFTATPKHNNGQIFVQTVCDYPLVEAIRQGVVKTPVLPDEASRAKLQERITDNYVEKYQDYLDLGYVEWKKTFDELKKAQKKAVLFVMTDVTGSCDEVGQYLEARYPELTGAVLVIHTNKQGNVNEKASSKAKKEELEALREASQNIDSWDSRYKAIVSVMMLREGWDVKNVTSIVGLRAYSAKSQILPEQTLGRGLRRMFRGEDVAEKVSVIGTDGFIEFVEQIKNEGVELEYAAMGGLSPAKAPMVIEVEHDNDKKDIDKLDIKLPVLTPRIYREYKNLHELKPADFGNKRIAVRQFTDEEIREIVFKNIDTDEISHTTQLESVIPADPRSVVRYFANTIMKALNLVGGFDVLYAKVKDFIENYLFENTVSVDEPNVMRNLSEPDVRKTLEDTLKSEINKLTAEDRGTSEIRHYLKFSQTRPVVVKSKSYITSNKTIFNKVIGDSGFELRFAAFLDKCEIVSFVKNAVGSGIHIEYKKPDGGIAPYYPDFIVRETESVIWVIETKGREDKKDIAKIARLKQWCSDASALADDTTYLSLYVKEEDWNTYKPSDFKQLIDTFKDALDKAINLPQITD
ncbi:DEAD/DEAH box helicase family protein [bacterium]|nr:DEAD/DEAH box helicase family protein [bacterium]